jgi:ribosomal protein L32
MSKKPVPKKKQSVATSKSRHSKWAQTSRLKLENANAFDVCPKCGASKRRHFACGECGVYKDRQVLAPKGQKQAPITEIEA